MSEIYEENNLKTQFYLKCKNCLQIEPETDWLPNRMGDSVCKHCKQANKAELWPSSEITEFISLSLYYLSSAVGQNPLIRQLMFDLKSRIDWLEETSEPQCPTCGQHLTEEHFHQVLDSLMTEGRQWGDRYRANQQMEAAGSDKLKFFSIILCCVVAEMILEEHLYVLAWTNHNYDESSHVIRALFAGYTGRDARLRMFKHMNLGSYQNLCERLGYGKMFKDWDKVVSVRNRLVHGKISEDLQRELDSIGLETIKAIFDGLLEVSRLDQNDYTSSFSYVYKSAVGPKQP